MKDAKKADSFEKKFHGNDFKSIDDNENDAGMQ